MVKCTSARYLGIAVPALSSSTNTVLPHIHLGNEYPFPTWNILPWAVLLRAESTLLCCCATLSLITVLTILWCVGDGQVDSNLSSVVLTFGRGSKSSRLPAPANGFEFLKLLMVAPLLPRIPQSGDDFIGVVISVIKSSLQAVRLFAAQFVNSDLETEHV